MKIQSVFDKSFAPYGKVIKGFDTAALEAKMLEMPCPDGAVVYVPSGTIPITYAMYLVLGSRPSISHEL